MTKTNKEYLKDFYANLSEDKKIKTCSECGQNFSYPNRSKHNKTKVHILLKEIKKQHNEQI